MLPRSLFTFVLCTDLSGAFDSILLKSLATTGGLYLCRSLWTSRKPYLITVVAAGEPEMGVPLVWSYCASSQDSVLVTCPITQLYFYITNKVPKPSMSSCQPFLLKYFYGFSPTYRLSSWSQVLWWESCQSGRPRYVSLPALTMVPLKFCPSQLRGLCGPPVSPPQALYRTCASVWPHRLDAEAEVWGSTVWRQESGDLCYSEIVWWYLFVFNASYIIFDRQILVKSLKSFW